MKYLTLVKQGPIPPEQAPALLQATREWFAAMLADGTFDCVYGFPEGGGMSISNADSHEEMLQKMREYPLFFFSEFEVRPLCDINVTVDATLAAMQRMSG